MSKDVSSDNIIKQGVQLSDNGPEDDEKWYLNIFQAAEIIGRQIGIQQFFGGGVCTFFDRRFYSYRRDGVTGRFATGIWLRGDRRSRAL